jgi:hypothetical protein
VHDLGHASRVTQVLGSPGALGGATPCARYCAVSNMTSLPEWMVRALRRGKGKQSKETV